MAPARHLLPMSYDAPGKSRTAGRLRAWGIALWTGLCLLVYALIEYGGNLLINNADVLPLSPEGVEWTFHVLNVLQGAGLVLLAVLWVIGIAVIYAIGGLARRFG